MADGSGGFDKAQLKKVEVAGGLSAKGYIPVMAIGDEVVRESSMLVERVAKLSAECAGAKSLLPEQPELSDELVRLCNSLPTSSSSRQLDAMIQRVRAALALVGASTLRSCSRSIIAYRPLPQSIRCATAHRQVDAELARSTFLAGERFSVADACLLPFLQRIEPDLPSDAKNVRAYMGRAHKLPAFSKTVMSSWWWWW